MKLKDALKKKKFVVTSEVQAPIDQEPEDLVRNLCQVRSRVDGVSLSEVEFEGIVGDTIKTCELCTMVYMRLLKRTMLASYRGASISSRRQKEAGRIRKMEKIKEMDAREF